MKIIFLIFTILVALATLKVNAGLPPTNLSGQSQTVRPTTFTFKTPARQATQTSGIESLIETGNPNILANPSYEHRTVASGWTSSVTATAVATYGTAVTDSGELGLRQATFSCAGGASGGVCTFFQDVRTTRILQGLALLYASTTDAASTRFISRVNGTKNQEILFQINSESPYKLPVILGSVSSGIGIEVTAGVNATITGTMDAATLGVQDIKQDVDQSRIAGESFFAGTASCNWTRTSTTIGAFATVAACPGPTIVDGSMGSWQTTDSDLPRQTINNLPAGKYKATFQFPAILSSSSGSVVTISDGTNVCNAVRSTDIATFAGQSVSCIFSYNSSGNRNFELQVASGAGTYTIANNSTAPAASIKFNLEYFGNSQVYSATNANTDWASCDHVAADFTGFGAVSAIETQCLRDGGDLLMKGKFTTGVHTSVEARLALKLNGVALISKGVSVIPSLQSAGDAIDNISASTFFRLATLMEPSVGYITFGLQGSTNSALNKVTATNLTSTQIISFNARIPIAGWDKSNVIIGTFNEVMTVPGVSKPKTCSYAFGGAGATLAVPTVCTTGTCVEVGDTCNSITPPAFSTTGVYTGLVIANSTFANSSPLRCECVSYSTTSGLGLGCNLYFITGSNTWASNATGGMTANISMSSGNNGYVQFVCIGAAPQ